MEREKDGVRERGMDRWIERWTERDRRYRSLVDGPKHTRTCAFGKEALSSCSRLCPTLALPSAPFYPSHLPIPAEIALLQWVLLFQISENSKCLGN